MSWIVFALLCACAEGLKDLTSKHGLGSVHPGIITWAFFLITTIICLPMFFIEDVSHLGFRFIGYLVIQALLFGVSINLYMKAISLSSLSLTIPLILFTPVFLLLHAPFTLGEWPTFLGVCGTMLIVTGSYLLNIKSITRGIFEPIKALMREPGARIMLTVSFIWSITSTIDKLAISETNAPLFWGISLYALVSIFLTLQLVLQKKSPHKVLRENWRLLLPIGFFNGVQLCAYVMAIQSGLVVYVLALKRTSILLVLVLGSVFFKDSKLTERVPAVLIMLIGVFCITLL